MRYLNFSLLAVLFFACTPKPITLDNGPVGVGSDATFIIGYTGGWGGGAAYKLEDGQLFESVKERGIGEAEDIVATEYKPLKSATGLAALRQLASEYSAATFAEVEPKFDCPEMAYDGTCPYLIVVENGTTKAWTKSKEDTDAAFVAYMEQVREALTKM